MKEETKKTERIGYTINKLPDIQQGIIIVAYNREAKTKESGGAKTIRTTEKHGKNRNNRKKQKLNKEGKVRGNREITGSQQFNREEKVQDNRETDGRKGEA